MPDSGEIRKALSETDPTKLSQMSPQTLSKYEQYFAGQLLSFGTSPESQQLQSLCQARLELLRGERQHREVHEIGQKTLANSGKTVCLAGWAVGVAIVGVIATIFVGILQIRHANIDTSKTSQAPQPTSRQMPTPVVSSPEPSPKPARPTPKQTPTVTPLPTTPTP